MKAIHESGIAGNLGLPISSFNDFGRSVMFGSSREPGSGE
jgi:hypothetical protein